MAGTEHSTPLPCAFCGDGEPSESKSHGICALCASHVELSDDLVLWRDPVLKRKVVLVPIASKNIKRAGWRNVDGQTGVLLVQFRGTGGMFRYVNVTRAWWVSFLQAASKGSFFHQTVRADEAAHPFTKIN